MARTIRDSNVDKQGEVFHRMACGRMVEDRKARLERQYAEYQLREAMGEPVG